MSPSICLLTANHLCHNPRVIKSASALARHGFSVEVLGAWSDPILKTRDLELLTSVPFRYTAVTDLTASKVSSVRRRVRRKVGQVICRSMNVENRWQLGYFYPELRRAAVNRHADLYIAHSEQAMAAAVALLQHGRRVGVDMEDWFSEDLLPDARKYRPLRLLRALERQLLINGTYASCPSRVMSAALAQEHGCRRPTVIYNAFEWSERGRLDNRRKDRADFQVPSIHWYSQTLGPGRGLKDLFAALPLLKREAEIHLRGRPTAGFDEWLKTQISASWQKKVFVHELVTNADLLSRIAEHDIGFSGEPSDCRSRDLTITNKILQYLLAGLAVVASNTSGQRELLEQAPNAVLLYSSRDHEALALQLNCLLESPSRLKSAKESALKAAQQTFCWEQQETMLVHSVETIFDRPDRSLVLRSGKS